jgi:hypothetical protein
MRQATRDLRLIPSATSSGPYGALGSVLAGAPRAATEPRGRDGHNRGSGGHERRRARLARRKDTATVSAFVLGLSDAHEARSSPTGR